MVGSPKSPTKTDTLLAERTRELAQLREELSALQGSVGELQRRRAAEVRHTRERRIEHLLQEWLPLPETLMEHPSSPQLFRTPSGAASRRSESANTASSRVSPRPATAAATCSRPAAITSKAGQTQQKPPRLPSPRVGATPKAPPKPSAAVQALASQMVDSPYNRPRRFPPSTCATATVAASTKR